MATTRRLTRDRLLCGAVAAGYLFLAVDTTLEHLVVIRSRWYAGIPPVAAALEALVLGLACALWSPATRRLARAALAISMGIGLLGLYFHNADRLVAGLDLTAGLLMPPLIAPLAFAGQGIVGLLALWEPATAT